MYGANTPTKPRVPYVERVPQPAPGVQRVLSASRCAYTYDDGTLGGNHNTPMTPYRVCDVDCDNLRIQEVYESFFIKYMLEDPSLSERILRVHEKVFAGLRRRSPTAFERVSRQWRSKPSQFPVNQKGNYTSVATSVPLSAGLLKTMALDKTVVGESLVSMREYIFEAVMHRTRGYRTNQKGRFEPGTTKYKKETQVGIANFDYPELELMTPEGARPAAWMHPGRSQCKVSVIQSSYQRASVQRDLVQACGVSGSTNFWVWTALSSGADLSESEVRLLLLSAYVTLGGDGGHSLQEVLSSAALTSVVFQASLRYAPSSDLAELVRSSTFAASLARVTYRSNPLGVFQGSVRPLSTRVDEQVDLDEVGRKIFAREYKAVPDTRSLTVKEQELRRELEAFFMQGRRHFPFSRSQDFWGNIPGAPEAEQAAVRAVNAYKSRYCSGVLPMADHITQVVSSRMQ
jgi:hypothetical protein